MNGSRPLPQPTALSKPHWDGCRQGVLRVQRCADCMQLRLPPAPVCPSCRSDVSDWKEISGRGTLYSYTVVHRPIAAGQEVPFAVAVIELDGGEGVRMISNVVDTPFEELAIGLAVEVVWEDMGPDFAMPRFRALRP